MKKALIIFQKNAELGKVKTRLAKDVGDKKAMEIYLYLCNYTHELIQEIEVDKFLYYSDYLPTNSDFPVNYSLHLQSGENLGERMYNAFQETKLKAYDSIAIIGTDCFELKKEILLEAFSNLENKDFVIGPATDGGYYLLGMNTIESSIFENKKWSSDTVFSDTIQDIEILEKEVFILKKISDIDSVGDLKELREKFSC